MKINFNCVIIYLFIINFINNKSCDDLKMAVEILNNLQDQLSALNLKTFLNSLELPHSTP